MTANAMWCDDAMHQLAVAILSATPAALTEAARSHLSTCSACRAKLLLLLRTSTAAPPFQHCTCAECEEDLAAFIDLERADPIEAAQSYPGVWWHLWLCADCLEAYTLTVTLLDAEQPYSWAIHQPVATPLIPGLPAVIIQHSSLLHLLPRAANLRHIARGPDRRHVLHDEPVDEAQMQQCTVWATQLDGGMYQVDVELQPRLLGAAELRCGAVWLRAEFDDEGWARLGQVPAGLLTEDAGPDLEIRFVELGTSN